MTRVRGNWILELDGRPALDVYREAAREPLAADLRRAAAHLLLALPRDAAESLAPGIVFGSQCRGLRDFRERVRNSGAAGSRAVASRSPTAIPRPPATI